MKSKPDTKPATNRPMGATVYAFVAFDAVGNALHRLEYRADIMLLGRCQCTRRGYEMWKLRSDSFPPTWNRSAVLLYAHKDDDGIDVELVNQSDDDLEDEYRGCSKA